MHLVIIDSPNAVFSKPFDQLILWQSYDESSFPNAVSIPLLVEKNANYLRSRYLQLIHDIGEVSIDNTKLYESLEIRPGFSYWWMTLMTEKCNWAKSPSITDIVQLFAFDDWTAHHQNIKSINLISANPELHECIQNWCRAREIHFSGQKLVDNAKGNSTLRQVFDK